MDPASNAAASESRDTVVVSSRRSNPSSPVHCSPEGQTASTTEPASPVFSASLVAESSSNADQRRRSSPPARHCPATTADRPQSALFSPPTDMDTDVSAIFNQAANDSELWKSDVSFEVTSRCLELCFSVSVHVVVMLPVSSTAM